MAKLVQILRQVGTIPFALLLFVGTSTSVNGQAILTPASGAFGGDFFGFSVSQSGTIGLVGASRINSFQGAAYVFRNLDTTNGTVTENVKLTASDGASVDYFSQSLSQSGTIGLVGAYGKNSSQGAAYVFRNLDTANGTVTQNVRLTASDGLSNNDRFGFSVSQSGTIGLVGAYNKNSSQGAAYLFRGLDTANGTVTQNVKLTASDAANGDAFGFSVSQSGTIGLVGASRNNSNQGAAYVFRNLDIATGTATQNVKLTASDAANGDLFGSRVSQSGTIGMVAAHAKNSNRGAAYVFRNLDTANGTVTENVKLIASDAARFDDFGWSVSLSGTIGLVGAYGKNSSQGAAYVFRGLDTATGTVTQNVKLIASDATNRPQFGYSVSISGDQFTIGSPNSNSNGRAYTGTVSSMTTLDLGTASRTIDGISFVSQDHWIIGQNTSNNQVSLNAGNTANVTASGKVVYIGQNAGSNNNTLVIAGTLTANQILVGAAGNTGNRLIVNGSISSSSAVTINDGSTLGGSGTVSGNVFVGTGATLSAGLASTKTAPGTLTVNGTSATVKMDAGSKLAFFQNAKLTPTAAVANSGNSGTAGIINNLLNVNGTFNVADFSNLTILLYGEADKFIWSQGYSFKVVEASNAISPFSITNQSQFDTTNFANFGNQWAFDLTSSGFSVYLNFHPVPEPSTMLLLCAGIGGFVTMRRRLGKN